MRRIHCAGYGEVMSMEFGFGELEKRAFPALAPLLLCGLAIPALAAPPVQDYGGFSRMQQTRDYSAKVQLRDAVPGPGWYAIGALAGLQGEIIAVDGRVFLSLGRQGGGRIADQPADDAQATLLATSRVEAWREIAVPGPMSQEQLHAFIVGEAFEAGFDPDQAFPFLLRGEIRNAYWHVLIEPHPGFRGHGGGVPMARRFESREASLNAEMVGFYSGARLQGMISHPGERFHIHFLDQTGGRAGHLDAYEGGAPLTLLLPVTATAP